MFLSTVNFKLLSKESPTGPKIHKMTFYMKIFLIVTLTEQVSCYKILIRALFIASVTSTRYSISFHVLVNMDCGIFSMTSMISVLSCQGSIQVLFFGADFCEKNFIVENSRFTQSILCLI